MSAPVDIVLGRYRLVRQLATGGMAEVFLAKAIGPAGFEKLLVIKRILPSLSEDQKFVEMFLHEARLAAQLNHPNVAQIFDFGEFGGTYFLAMEYVDGPNLRTILRKSPGQRIAAGVGARLVALACEGLAYAHELVDHETGAPLALIHRDVSADNLLIARTGAVKVVDFGVAKIKGQVSSTSAGSVRGKIAYMPPEQILGDPDLRSDVYALGVILYELLAGARPYEAPNEVQLITNILQKPPSPLLSRAPDAPPQLVAVIERAMAREPSQRYQTCRELQGALEDFLDSTGERVGPRQLAALVAATSGGPALTAPASEGTPAPAPSAPGTGPHTPGNLVTPAPLRSGATPAATLPSRPAPLPAPSAWSPPPRPASGGFPVVPPPAPRNPSGVFPVVAAPSVWPSRPQPPAPEAPAPASDPLGAALAQAAQPVAPSWPSPSRPPGPPPSAPASDPLGAALAQAALPVSPSWPAPSRPPGPPPPAPTSDPQADALSAALAQAASTLPAAPAPSRPAVAPPPSAPRAAPARDTLANAVFADAEQLRGYAAGAPLAPPPQLAKLQQEYERDESVNLASRFAGFAARLSGMNPSAPTILADRLAGAVTGLLVAEDLGRLARLLGFLQAARDSDPAAGKMWETALQTFNEPAQVRLMLERLRDATVVELEAVEQLVGFLSPELLPQLLKAFEPIESPAVRQALLNGMVRMAAVSPAPFLTRVMPRRPHQRLTELCFVLEKAKAADRQAAFQDLLGRKHFQIRHQTLAGLARAGNEEAIRTLHQALTDADEAIRLSALELLGKHVPGRVFKLLEKLLTESALESRTAAERVAIWRAAGSSDQPEAFYWIADVLKQKGSLLNKSKLETNKLHALEGLATFKNAKALELLKAVAADRNQPIAVSAAAARFATEQEDAAARRAAKNEAPWSERVASTPRAVVLDLAALTQAASVLDVGSPELARGLARLEGRLGALIHRERAFRIVIKDQQVLVNGAVVDDEAPERGVGALAGALTGRGIVGASFERVDAVELRELVRWLAEGDWAGEVRAPHLLLAQSSGAVITNRPAPVPPTPGPDPTREAIERYAVLQRAQGALLLGGVRPDPSVLAGALDALVELYLGRGVRFLGLMPAEVGTAALPYHHANVMVLSLAFGVELGLPRQRLRELAEVALFHDVGMGIVPEETLLRAGELLPVDRDALRKARLASAWFPFERVGTSRHALNWAVSVVEYGLDWGARDAAGAIQPRNEIGVLGGILALAKTYDALTSRRSYRPALTSEEAVKVLSDQAAHRFRPDLLSLFVTFVKALPVRVLPRPKL